MSGLEQIEFAPEFTIWSKLTGSEATANSGYWVKTVVSQDLNWKVMSTANQMARSGMSTKITNLTNKAGETLGTLSFEDGAHSWRIATKAEPNFPSTFSTQQDAFYCWYTRFDPKTGKLRG